MQKTSDLYKELLAGEHQEETRLSIGETGVLITKNGEDITFGGVSILVGATGADGKSAYELAVEAGFEGTLEEWLDSLAGDGKAGASAYDVAIANGFVGTEAEWLASLKGEAGKDGKSAYELAVENGYEGNVQQWLASLVGAAGKDGADGKSA